jgi:ribokinase
MSVLFVGDIGIDTSLVVSHAPEADEKVVADTVTDHVGGVVANAACAAVLAGAEARIVCGVGTDAAGRDAVSQLGAAGVTVEASAVPGATCRALILIDASGEKRLVLAPGDSMYPPAEAVRAVDVAGASWVHTAAYDLDAAAVLAGRCREEGVPWSVDLEPATIPANLSQLAPVMCGAAVVFCNARAVARLGGTGESAAGHLLAMGVRALVLTRGALGVRYVGAEGHTDIRPGAGLPLVVDTTGAGDCLAGWFAGRIDAGDDPLTALAEAVAAASLSCARLGAQSSYPGRPEVVSAGAARAIRTSTVTDTASTKHRHAAQTNTKRQGTT